VTTQIPPPDFQLHQTGSSKIRVVTISTSTSGAPLMHFRDPASGVDLDLAMVNVMKAKLRSHIRLTETNLVRDQGSKHSVA